MALEVKAVALGGKARSGFRGVDLGVKPLATVPVKPAAVLGGKAGVKPAVALVGIGMGGCRCKDRGGSRGKAGGGFRK